MEPIDVDVDVDEKAEWSARNDVIFIRILHDHVKKGNIFIPIACCVLHNFIRSQGRDDRMFREYENEDMLIYGEAEGRPNPNIDLSPSNVALMSNVRDEIAKKKNVARLLT
ncbi:hypothetical protein Dsin_006253 [Dipteronia sinensis]|uniref:Uncharacterized protein n=1 Tax=Dipteronia sinensis TaxID=43782 RepID=A0AAE0AY26_9ROSI|nr:hypothetical protein Dsin_006253 [Dipteronia sinensis]